jgi:hypothetical protein
MDHAGPRIARAKAPPAVTGRVRFFATREVAALAVRCMRRGHDVSCTYAEGLSLPRTDAVLSHGANHWGGALRLFPCHAHAGNVGAPVLQRINRIASVETGGA